MLISTRPISIRESSVVQMKSERLGKPETRNPKPERNPNSVAVSCKRTQRTQREELAAKRRKRRKIEIGEEDLSDAAKETVFVPLVPFCGR
jgi:hypothetical protein